MNPDEGDAVGLAKDLVDSIPKEEFKPAAAEMGKAALTLAKAVNVALAPVTALVWGFEQIRDNVVPAICERLQKSGAEVVSSPINVAGPAIEALRFCGSDPILRDMFVKLLATSMDARTTEKGHPSFVDIIRQITPDEARIVSCFSDVKHISLALPLHRPRGAEVSSWLRAKFVTPTKCQHPHLVDSYLDNLERLGLLKRSELNVSLPNSEPELRIVYAMSSLGQQFYDACMKD